MGCLICPDSGEQVTREGQAWNWRSGKPVWGEIRQPDSVHVRIRHKDIGVLQEYGYLVVTSPRILTLQTADRTLGPSETVDPMTRILPKVFPEPTRGLDGTSRMELQCRFGDEGWKTCPAEGWNHGASRSGRVELRVVWSIQGRGEPRIVIEPAHSWIITTRTPEEQGIVKATVKLDGRRLARLLDTASGVVTALRRTNTDLPIWSATPPVVRTMEGEVLPQQTESYDPVQKTWLAWVALPALSAQRDLDLELWIGDQSPVPSPWSLPEVKPTQRLADGGNASSHLGELAMNAGIQQDWNLPSADRGWSASLWTRWNGSPQTVWRSARFTLGIDDSGSLWATLGGQSLRSAPHVLDRLGPHLLAASWNEGDLELWSNGIRVATARIDAQGDGPFPIGTSHLNAVDGLDEIRWESWRSPGTWAVRYAAERPRGDLWNVVSSVPVPSILASYTVSGHFKVIRSRTLESDPLGGRWES